MAQDKHLLRLRITLVAPPAGVDFALQKKGVRKRQAAGDVGAFDAAGDVFPPSSAR